MCVHDRGGQEGKRSGEGKRGKETDRDMHPEIPLSLRKEERRESPAHLEDRLDEIRQSPEDKRSTTLPMKGA